jgi:hypothetical protein
MSSYADFLASKQPSREPAGFEPLWIPAGLFPFQADLTRWAVRQGRCALFEDCGLGKTFQQLVWAENVVRKMNKPVLVITPLAVGPQTIREGRKFGIEVRKVDPNKIGPGIHVTNYERLHYLDPKIFGGVVGDESGAIKHFTSRRQKDVTEFFKPIPRRLLCTATPAPND